MCVYVPVCACVLFRLKKELTDAQYDSTVAEDEILHLQALNDELTQQIKRLRANKAAPRGPILTLDGGTGVRAWVCARVRACVCVCVCVCVCTLFCIFCTLLVPRVLHG